jgi:hypothetical protein
MGYAIEKACTILVDDVVMGQSWCAVMDSDVRYEASG